MKNIVLGVTGGIAAYKALEITSRFIKENYNINVIMTKAACEFVTPLSFQSLSRNMVTCDMFETPNSWEIKHISLASKADIILIAPATADIIGKIANGIADDMLSTTVMASKAPVVFAPAMNCNMYENPIVKENINKLRSLGYLFIEPESGVLACGDIGKGRLADVDNIVSFVKVLLSEKKDLKNKKVLVTAGPTIAPIDPVRYITNHSSGKMGYAIARKARDRGADVVLISGPVSIKPPLGIELINVRTNQEMYESVLEHFEESNIVIMSAAVSDYKAKFYSDEKIKKNENGLLIEMIKDNDILMKLGKTKTHQTLIGFAAESCNLLENAMKKLKSKNLDYIVANDIKSIDTGFKSDDNKVLIIEKSGNIIPLEKMPKSKVAEKLFDIILK